MNQIAPLSPPEASARDLVGRAVWGAVEETVRDAPRGSRAAFLLAALPPWALAGIADRVPGPEIDGRSLKLGIDGTAAAGETIDPAFLTTESPIHWRHSNEAQIVVFAPSDAQRDGIGAGLGPVERIDGDFITSRVSSWVDELEPGTDDVHRNWLRNALGGLRASGVCVDLQMWVDFIMAIKAQGFERLLDKRLQLAAPALHIPAGGVEKLPKLRRGGPAPSQGLFRTAFSTARREVGCYAMLSTPSQEPIDIDRARERLADAEKRMADGNGAATDEDRRALAVIRALLDDADRVRPGEWTGAQAQFCHEAMWDRHARPILHGKGRPRSAALGARTLEYLNGDYGRQLRDEDREFLAKVDTNGEGGTPSPDEEQEFFRRWQDALDRQEAGGLYGLWYKRVFDEVVEDRDLLTVLAKGLAALVATGSDALAEMKDPRVLIRADQHDKKSFWNKLDRRVYRLFVFEVRSLQGLLGDRFVWDIDKCFEAKDQEDKSGKDVRVVRLELHLVEGAEIEACRESGRKAQPMQGVQAIWQPGRSAGDSPISLALPEDIEALGLAAADHGRVTPVHKFASKTHNDRGKRIALTLGTSTSFSDVSQGDAGRTVDLINGAPSEDLLEEVRAVADRMAKDGALSRDGARPVMEAIDAFGRTFREALKALHDDPADAFSGSLIDDQAHAFGELCLAVRQACNTPDARAEVMRRVSEIGLVRGTRGERRVILAAWHPLRLAESKAKALDFRRFTQGVLDRGDEGDLDLTVAFDERVRAYDRWVFPEAAVIDEVTYVSVEDVGGYSLMVPASDVARDRDALEQTARPAAKRFLEGIDEYLAVHPHEVTSLSAAIFDSESLSLPQEIARLLTTRIHRDPDLRCDLVITHRDQRRMREIYEDQNTRLEAEGINGTVKGFLSRLRVGVEPAAGAGGDGARDMDLAFLHCAISHHARTEWEHEAGGGSELPDGIDLRAAFGPRRRGGDAGTRSTGVYLTVPRPPLPVASYYDLLYTLQKRAILPDDMHAVLTRTVAFGGAEVRATIDRVHRLAEWVVSFDPIADGELLRACGVHIIRDVTLPNSDVRVIVSAGDVDAGLQRRVRTILHEACTIDDPTAAALGEALLSDVIEVAGRKILSAASYDNASRELIGLAVSKGVMASCLPRDAMPIWISLDDHRSWFTSGRGEIADLLAVQVSDEDHRFGVRLLVGEAKFVGSAGRVDEAAKSRGQLRATSDRLKAILVDNADRVSRAAWCGRLADLLVNRGGLQGVLPDPRRRAAFLEAMAAGEVEFGLAGESVICVHDAHDHAVETAAEADRQHLRQHVLRTPHIRAALEAIRSGSRLDIAGIGQPDWHGPAPSDHGGAPLPPEGPAAAEVEKAGAVDGGPIDHVPIRRGPGPEQEEPTGTAEAPMEGEGVAPPGPRFLPAALHDELRRIRSEQGDSEDEAEGERWVEETCRRTQQALSHFGMNAVFAAPAHRLTPNGLLVNFRGDPSLTLAGVDRRRDELLTTAGLEVIDVRGAPGVISLFIKRPKRARVPLASTWLDAAWPDREPGVATNFLVGVREDDGSELYLNLEGEHAGYEEHGPHTLIAGETKSGKGVLTQGLLLQLVAFNDPANAELILVDPKKGVDFAWLAGTPHLRRPIVTEMAHAQAMLDELVQEMDARYERLAARGVPNISEYNEEVGPDERMPRIFLVHDEIGAWTAQDKKYRETVLSAVSNLGMKARAAGIHLTLITQRADVDAVPGRLRDNMGNRLCLRVQNATGSKMILNCTGAENLLGRGHLAATFTGESNPPGQDFFTAQVPFASTSAFRRLAKAAISHWTGRAG